jgi:hypothetical protein
VAKETQIRTLQFHKAFELRCMGVVTDITVTGSYGAVNDLHSGLVVLMA